MDCISNLTTSTQTFDAIFSLPNIGICTVNNKGIVTMWNIGAEKISGYKNNEVINKPYTDFFYSVGYIEPHSKLLSMECESCKEIEFIVIFKNGRKSSCAVTCTHTYNEVGDKTGSVLLFHAVTEKGERSESCLDQKSFSSTLMSVFENLSSAFCLYELIETDGIEDLKFVAVNQAYSQWIGIPCDDLTDKLFTDICSDDMDYFANYISVAKGGESRSFEAYSFFLKKEISGVVYSPSKGLVAIVMIDRTRLVRAEQELRASENDLALLFTSMTSGFCMGKLIRDESGDVVDIYIEMANKAFEEMEDYEHGSLHNKKLSEVRPSRDDTYAQIYIDVATKKIKRLFRKHIPTRQTILDVICYSPKDDYFVLIENDISERVKAENELQKAYRDTEAILHEIPAPICVVNKDSGLILDCNTAFTTMCMAQAKSSIIKTHISEYFKPASSEPFFSTTAYLHKGVNFNCMLKKLDKTVIEVEVFSRPFIYRDSQAFAVYCLDLTKQNEHERVLKEAAYQAEEASRMKTNFLANMSHEIRTPMNGVLGFIELALDSENLPAEVIGYLTSIKTSASGLLEIINDVLDIAKLEADKMEIEKTEFDIYQIFDDCKKSFEAKAEEKGINLLVSTECLEGKRLVGDPAKLRKIFFNLLSNSIKFTNDGVVNLLASVLELTDDSVTLHFEINDSGIGMSKEQMVSITEPFTQVDSSTTRRYGGTGLGLTITRGLIELMGGSLTIESDIMVGSKFYFDLTFELTDKIDNYDISANGLKQQLKKPIFKSEVLICEDNPINQQVIKEHLVKIGINPIIAVDGTQGVQIAAERMESKNPFDIIFMDIHMPVMDGFEAADNLRLLGNKSPIIAMSANVLSIEKRYLELMSGYLPKPFSHQELWSCLLKFLTPVALINDENNENNKNNIKNSAINTELGLERSARNEKLYNGLLLDFLKNYENCDKKIDSIIEEKDQATAHRLAHTLKGVAATIGAERLSKAALSVENLIEENKYVPGCLEGRILTSELLPVLREIKAMADSMQATDKKEIVNFEIDINKAKELYNRLLILLEHGNSESLDLVEEAAMTFSKYEECNDLIELIEDFEYDEALIKLSEIRTKLDNECSLY